MAVQRSDDKDLGSDEESDVEVRDSTASHLRSILKPLSSLQALGLWHRLRKMGVYHLHSIHGLLVGRWAR